MSPPTLPPASSSHPHPAVASLPKTPARSPPPLTLTLCRPPAGNSRPPPRCVSPPHTPVPTAEVVISSRNRRKKKRNRDVPDKGENIKERKSRRRRIRGGHEVFVEGESVEQKALYLGMSSSKKPGPIFFLLF